MPWNHPAQSFCVGPLCTNSFRANLPRKSCSSCKQIKYCSRKCQSGDWKMHKIFCKNFPSNIKRELFGPFYNSQENSETKHVLSLEYHMILFCGFAGLDFDYHAEEVCDTLLRDNRLDDVLIFCDAWINGKPHLKESLTYYQAVATFQLKRDDLSACALWNVLSMLSESDSYKITNICQILKPYYEETENEMKIEELSSRVSLQAGHYPVNEPVNDMKEHEAFLTKTLATLNSSKEISASDLERLNFLMKTLGTADKETMKHLEHVQSAIKLAQD